MSIEGFVRDLELRGIELSVDGDGLSLRAPKGALSETDRELLRQRKPAILAWLKGDAGASDDTFPLTDIQEAYLVGRAAELELGRVGCHAYREFEAPAYDLAGLEAAWNKLVRRHPMLRAVIDANDRQRVLVDVPAYAVPVLDLRTAADAEARLAELRATRSHHVFDPRRWPLFDIRATLLPDAVRLHVGIDLLIADAVGLVQLSREWSALAAAPMARLPTPAGSFADHCRALARRRPAAAGAYWAARLPSLPGGPDLPRRKLQGAPRFARWTKRLDRQRWAELQAAGRARGLTPSALLAAVYADVLAAWSRRDRFAIVLTTFAAPPGMAHVVGDFTSTVLLEIDTRPASFAERASVLQRRLAGDLEHAGMSGVRVMRELRKSRPDLAPIATVFTSTLGHTALAGEPPLAWLGRSVYAITQTPQVAIDHHVLEEAGELVAAWDVLTGVFPDGVVDAMFAAYGRRLEALAAGSGWSAAISTLLPATVRPAPVAAFTPEPLFMGFLRQAAAAPERPAVFDTEGELSYAALAAASAAGAAWLSQQGAEPGRIVAVDLAKGWRQVVACLAIQRAGAAYLPLDPAWPAARRAELIRDTAAIEPAWDGFLEDWRAIARGGAVVELPAVDPSSLAYVIFTSGSTGRPKGVMVEHGAALNTVLEVNRRWDVGSSDRVLGLSALSFDLSVWDLFGPLMVGGAVVLPDAEQRRDPSAWASLIRQHAVTVWNSVPALAAMLTAHGLPPDHELRLFLLSGDWLPLELVPQLRAMAPAARLVSLGGATEAAIWSIAHEIDELDPAWPSVPYGEALANQTIDVVNARREPCPDWVVGEIEIGGLGLARGYWDDAARTAGSFAVDPQTGERRYRTGDLGRFRPCGRIEFLGREDFQVKVQGHRIELGEIEAHLQTHAAIRQAVVTAWAPAQAPDEKTLHAFIIPQAHPRAPASPLGASAAAILERPGRRRLNDRPMVGLSTRPEPGQFERRRSIRTFASRGIPVAALDTLLGRLVSADRDLVRHLYPSAGSLYAVQTYIAIRPGRVEGLAAGVYYHDPVEHRLVQLSQAAPELSTAHGPTAETVAEAAFAILLVANLSPMQASYGAAARDFCLLEAGYIGQLLMTDLAGLELGLCPVGGLEVSDLAGAAALGPAQELLHALVGGVPGERQAGDLQGDLRRHLAERLPDYMVPRSFTLIDALPLTANGKVDRQALRPPQAPTSSPQPGGDALLTRVGALVGEILGRAAPGPAQNLFDLGATSLHIVKLQRRLVEAFGHAPAVVELFRLPTTGEVARWLAAEGSAAPAGAEGAVRAAKRLEARARRGQ